MPPERTMTPRVRCPQAVEEIASICGNDRKLIKFVKRLAVWFDEPGDVLLILREARDTGIIKSAAAAIRAERERGE